MTTPDPIRNKEQILKFRQYYKKDNPNPRNYLLLLTGLNTALRISDILNIRFCDVFDFTSRSVRQHLLLKEQKTGKTSHIFINNQLKAAISEYVNFKELQKNIEPDELLFGISRIQAWRVVKKAADFCGIEGVISCHSLRKTFGYFAWKQGVEPALLMDVFNHSSYAVTKHYLGITQDDRDKIFMDIEL